jgi:hypothetical protein
MKKKGQVTIFIIIAVIIIAFVGGFFLFRDELASLFTPENEPIYLFVESCIEDTGKDAIHYIAKNGGYLFSPELSTSEGIPYYYYNGKNYMPSKKRVEEEISYYMNEMLSFCTEDFIDFPDFNITQGKIKTETKIKNDEVVLNVEYPLSIKKEESVTLFEDFKNIKIPVRLGIIYNSIQEIIQDQLTYENICLSCISDIALENDLTVDMGGIEEAIIFSVIDEYSKIKDAPVKWRFANKYKVE